MRITRHARERMRERGLERRDILAVMAQGRKERREDGSIRWVHGDRVVVLDGKKVVTVW